MARGRPVRSEIRQNIAELLAVVKEEYGYEVTKLYLKIFPAVSQRVIYYHLRKGVELEEFRVSKVEKSKGNYSWGGEAEKTYYALGKKAEVKGNPRVKKWFEKNKKKA